jgi:hypothetical protein
MVGTAQLRLCPPYASRRSEIFFADDLDATGKSVRSARQCRRRRQCRHEQGDEADVDVDGGQSEACPPSTSINIYAIMVGTAQLRLCPPYVSRRSEIFFADD